MEHKFSSDGIRTHACLRTEDLKSPPLDLAPALMNGDSDGGRTRNLPLIAGQEHIPSLEGGCTIRLCYRVKMF